MANEAQVAERAAEIRRWCAIVAEESARLKRLDPRGVRLSRSDLERFQRRLADLLSET